MNSGHSAFALALVLLSALGCADPEPGKREAFRVTLIGVDGATFEVLGPLLEAGALQGGFARLVQEGTRAPLRSEHPLYSPPIWTTIATGVSRREHGIERFELRDGKLVSSLHRRAPALWNLASRAGLRSSVVGWWGTYPAEAIDGVIISERALKLRESDLRLRFGKHLASSSFDQLAHPTSALELLPRNPSLGAQAAATPHEVQLRAAEEDRITAEAFRSIGLERGPFDLSLVLLRGIDPVSHVFWRYRTPGDNAYAGIAEDPKAAAVGASPERVIDKHYQRVDRLIDSLVTPSESHVVLVVSDHGFEARFEGAPLGIPITGHHRSDAAVDGIFLAAGGPIRRGARLEPEAVSIYDLAPTVLHLLGLPVPESMPGQVPESLFEPGWLAAHPVLHGPPPAGPPHDVARTDGTVEGTSPEVNERLREELRALGYIE